MTLKEVQTYLKVQHDNKPVYQGDYWVACVGNDGKRDWVQIGSHHSLGKSHSCWGYPGWGDEKRRHGHRLAVIWITVKKDEDKEKKDDEAKKSEKEDTKREEAKNNEAEEEKVDGDVDIEKKPKEGEEAKAK